MKKIDLLKQKICRDDLYDVYITQNKTLKQTMQYFGISEKDTLSLLKDYGIKKDHKLRAKNNHYVRSEEMIKLVAQKSAETQRKRWQNMPQEKRDEWAEQCRQVELGLSQEVKDKKSQDYRDYWYSLSQEERDLINNKRSSSLITMWKDNDDAKERQHKSQQQTRIQQKGKLCKTKAEQSIYDYLIQIYPDLQYDVKVDSRYPFYCDFYIPSQDLFIEYQGHPSHGRLPIEFMDESELLKYSDQWLNTLSNRDVNKQEYAIKNKLNIIRYYPSATVDENIMINGKQHEKMIKLIRSIKLY